MDNQSQDVVTQVLPNKRNYRIPILSIIELKEKNLTNSEIAKLLDCHPSNIWQRTQDIENTNKYVSHRAKYFAHLQRKILEQITDADIKKASLRDKIISASVLYDKEALELGHPTSIVAYADLIKAKEQVRREREELTANP